MFFYYLAPAFDHFAVRAVETIKVSCSSHPLIGIHLIEGSQFQAIRRLLQSLVGKELINIQVCQYGAWPQICRIPGAPLRAGAVSPADSSSPAHHSPTGLWPYLIPQSSPCTLFVCVCVCMCACAARGRARGRCGSKTQRISSLTLQEKGYL